MPVPPDDTPDRPAAVAAPPRRGDALAAGVLALVLLSAFAGVRDLWDADEGRYGTVALDMVRSGDYLTPREHGMRFMDKPPLVYWMACGAYAVFGATPFAARLPCVVAGATLAMLGFLFAARFTGSRRAGYAAAIVVATSAGGMGFSRTVTMDMGLSAAIAGALYAGLRALERPAGRWRALLGLCVGAGLLVKGPLAAVATALVAFAWATVGLSWRATLRTLVSPTAWAVALLVAAPWYALMERANPGYLEHFVTYEHFRRFREPGHRDFAPVWLYAAVLPLFLVPWTLLLPRARMPRPVAAAARRPVPAHRLAWAWVVVLLVLYSAGRNRLFTYALPMFLPLAVLAGARLAALVEDAAGTREALLGPTLAGAVVVAGGLALAGLNVVMWGPEHSDDPHARAPWSAYGFGVIALVAGLPLSTVRLWLGRTPRARLAGLAVAAAALWWGLDLAAAQFDAKRSPRELAATLVREAGPDDLVVCVDLLPQGLRFTQPDLVVAVAGKQPEIVEPWATKDGAGRLFTLDALAAMWDGPRRIVLVAREKKAAPWLARGGRELARNLSGAQRADLWVLENRPRAR